MTDDRGLEPPSIEPAAPPEAWEPVPLMPEPAVTESAPAVAAPAHVPPAHEQSASVNRFGAQRERVLLVSTGVLFVIGVLLALMVFAPSIAPIKLGVARQAGSLQTGEIEAVAKRFARNFWSIDYRTLDSDFDAMRQDATPDLVRQLSQLNTVVRKPYRSARSISTGRPTRIVVLSQTKDVATVRLTVSVSISNVRRKEPKTEDRSLELMLIRTASGWKVSQIRAPTTDENQ